MQTATSETESKSRDLSICVHHYTLRAPCPKGQGNRPLRPPAGRFVIVVSQLACDVLKRDQMYAAEKDCPATKVTGPRQRLPPCPPPPFRVASGDRVQRLPGFNAPAMTRG